MQRLSSLSPSRLPRVLIAVAAVLAVIGTVLAATGAGDSDDRDVATRSATGRTTTTVAGLDGDDETPALPGAVAPPASEDERRRPTPTTTSRRTGTTEQPDAPPTDCPTPPSTNAQLAAAVPPAAGTYEYVSCADSEEQSDETRVEEKPGDPKRRLITSNLGGFPQTKTYFYGPSGIFQESFSVGGVATCDWNPDVLEFPSTVDVGTSWSTDSRCTVTSPQGTGTIHVAGPSKITGKVAFPVGGTPVNAWVIESTAHLTVSGRDQRGQSQSTEYDIVSRLYYDPAHGVDLYRNIELRSRDGNTTIIDRLKSITPGKS